MAVARNLAYVILLCSVWRRWLYMQHCTETGHKHI